MGKSIFNFKFLLGAAFLVVALLLARFFHAQEFLEKIRNSGIFGTFLFVATYVFATVFFVPGSLLTLGAGAIFGVVKGSLVVSVGSTLGAGAAFFIGRTFARNWVSNKVGYNPKFQAMDQAVAREGRKIVFLVRLSPIFPFNLVNYAFGLTKVSFKDYILASWIGMVPGTVMYVYFGSVAGNLAVLSSTHRTKTSLEWILYGVGLLATVLVTIFVTKIAKKALKEKIS